MSIPALAALALKAAADTPPSVIIENGVNPTFNSTLANGTFTGDVWLQSIFNDNDTSIAHVIFTPSARTYWHRHEKGQLLSVVAGAGMIGDMNSQTRLISAGDIIWCPPGVIHWHGADVGSYMIHLAPSYGEAEWSEEVSEDEFAGLNVKAG